MKTISIEADAEFFRDTLNRARRQIRTLLYSGRIPFSFTDDIGLELAHVCGLLAWCCDALDPEGTAETRFRNPPPLIPSERADYADLLDAWTIDDPWGEPWGENDSGDHDGSLFAVW